MNPERRNTEMQMDSEINLVLLPHVFKTYVTCSFCNLVTWANKVCILPIEVKIAFLSVANKILTRSLASPDFSISINDTLSYQTVKSPRLLFLASASPISTMSCEFILHPARKLNVQKLLWTVTCSKTSKNIQYTLFEFCSDYGTRGWVFIGYHQTILLIFSNV